MAMPNPVAGAPGSNLRQALVQRGTTRVGPSQQQYPAQSPWGHAAASPWNRPSAPAPANPYQQASTQQYDWRPKVSHTFSGIATNLPNEPMTAPVQQAAAAPAPVQRPVAAPITMTAQPYHAPTYSTPMYDASHDYSGQPNFDPTARSQTFGGDPARFLEQVRSYYANQRFNPVQQAGPAPAEATNWQNQAQFSNLAATRAAMQGQVKMPGTSAAPNIVPKPPTTPLSGVVPGNGNLRTAMGTQKQTGYSG